MSQHKTNQNQNKQNTLNKSLNHDSAIPESLSFVNGTKSNINQNQQNASIMPPKDPNESNLSSKQIIEVTTFY